MKRLSLNVSKFNIAKPAGILIIFYFLLPVYLYSVDVYGYLGYYPYTGINMERLLLSTFLVLFYSFYGNFLGSEFLKLTYYVCLILLFIGENCIYVCCNDVSLTMIIVISVFLTLFQFLDKIKWNIPYPKFDKGRSLELLFILAILLMIPFFQYWDQINLKNLLLQEIYETRFRFRQLGGSLLIGYIKEPLARVILPILIIDYFRKGKKCHAALSVVMLLYLFLCGGLKSIFFGLIALIAFYPGSYKKKVNWMIYGLLGAVVFGVSLYHTAGIDFLISIYRRVFLIPPRFNAVYIDYFKENLTHYSHSGFALVKDARFITQSVSEFVGQHVMGTGTNANTGIFVEGYYSFGLFGAFLYLFIPLGIIFFLKELNFAPNYYGLVFVYIYYMNTSILSTLLLSHGLFVFLMVSFIYLRERKQEHSG